MSPSTSSFSKALSILVITSSIGTQVQGRPKSTIGTQVQGRPISTQGLQGFTYRGRGFCENDQGSTFSYNTIYDQDITTVGKCAEVCVKQYSSDASFSGINFLDNSWGTNCNCMMGPNLQGSGGQITGANGPSDELCYSWDSTPPDEGIDGYTFRGLGHCENQRGSTLSYNTIFGVETVQECGSACVDRYSSNNNFRGINFLPSMLQMQKRRGVPPTWSEPNCNCMMEEGSGGDIVSANGINEELCYSWDGEVSEHPAFGFRGFKFQGMGCCLNNQGGFFRYETVPANDIFECAETCKESFKYDEQFVGINFLLEDDWTNCNCMLSDSGNGKITGSSDVGCESEYCYSWNEANPSTETVDMQTM